MTHPLASRPRVGLVFLGIVLVATVFLIARHGTLVPFWDGRAYADCIIDAAKRHLAPATLRCAGHPTQAFMLFAGAIQMLSPESFYPMLLAQTLLYLLSCAAVYRLAQLAFPGEAHRVDRALVTAVFAAQPVVLASVVQPNIDLPLLPAFLWGTVFIIRRRWLPLIGVGAALAFTKETGVLLYITLVAAYAIAMILPRPSSPRSPTRTMLRLAPLAIPVFAFAAYVAYASSASDQGAVWTAAGSRRIVVFQFLFPRLSRAFINYLALMLVLSFAWVATSVLVADGLAAIVRKALGRPPRPLPGSKRRIVRFLVFLGIATMYALTRFSTWGNARYLLPVFALTPLMLYGSLVRFGVPARARRPLLAVLATLLVISVERSIDPVSRRLYGTFAIGDHDLLRMTGVSGECCGAGRDQLVYNLQFTVLDDLTSDATEALMGDSTVVFLPALTRWFNVGRLDPATRRRTLRREGALDPVVMEPDTLPLLPAAPSDAIFIGLPNGDPDAAIRALSARYDVGAPHRVRRGGYWMDAYRLTLRDGNGS